LCVVFCGFCYCVVCVGVPTGLALADCDLLTLDNQIYRYISINMQPYTDKLQQ
jgi:hypothetical protein